MTTYSSILAWKRSLVGYSPWDCSGAQMGVQLTPLLGHLGVWGVGYQNDWGGLRDADVLTWMRRFCPMRRILSRRTSRLYWRLRAKGGKRAGVHCCSLLLWCQKPVPMSTGSRRYGCQTCSASGPTCLQPLLVWIPSTCRQCLPSEP